MPWAVLAFAVGGALLTLEPLYCTWLCPFKTVTEFSIPYSPARILQTVLFGSIFLGLVILLPLLSRKRTQCAFFCPLGALQGLSNRVNPFEIRIDRSSCLDCGTCERNCPTLSLDRESIRQGRTHMNCTRCGACVDACPNGSAAWHIKGTPVGCRPERARLLYLHAGWAFAILFGGGILTASLATLFHLVK
jgi:ferredoxin